MKRLSRALQRFVLLIRIEWRAITITLLALAALLLIGHFGKHEVPRFEAWIAGLGAWGPLAYSAIFIAFVPIGLSVTAMALLAGALFGLVKGTIVLIITGFITEVLMFYLARVFMRKRVERYIKEHPNLSAIDDAATAEGVKIQIMVRLLPIPYAICCYILALTRTTFKTYLLGFAGFIPGNFIFVYMGFAAKHVTTLAAGMGRSSALHNVVLIGGFVAAVLIFAYLARMAHKTWRDIHTTHNSTSAI